MNEHDPRTYQDLTWFQIAISIVLGTPLYFFFAQKDQEFRGFFASISLSIILLLAWVLKPLHQRANFWPSLTAIALTHVAIGYFLPYTGRFTFGFTFFPLFFSDAYLSARLIIYLCGARLQD